MATYDASRLLSVGLLIVLSASCAGGQQTPAADEKANTQAVASSTEPKTMTELPPVPPKVICNGDQLTIAADNSTLGSILAAVHGCAGVQIDIPDGATSSRVFDHLGPGSIRQVLTTLLNGTDFDYVIGSSVSNPQKIETILLTLRTSDAPAGNATGDRSVTPLRRAWMQSRENAKPAPARSSEEPSQVTGDSSTPAVADDSTSAPADSPSGTVPQAPANSPNPPAADAPAASAEPPAAPPADAGANSSPEKSPTEDKITNMQQLFEQRKQMIENQSAPPK